jgi:hypothetical protein
LQQHDAITCENVVLAIPCPSSEPPEVTSIDGDYRYDQRVKVFFWDVGTFEGSASLEFACPEIDADDFYPINVGSIMHVASDHHCLLLPLLPNTHPLFPFFFPFPFQVTLDSATTYAQLDVESVTHVDGGDCAFVAASALTADRFEVLGSDD